MLSTLLKPLRATASFLKNWYSEQIEGKTLPRRVEGDHLILFVHGLSGSALGTWTPMLKAFKADTELDDYAFDCYSYPTKLLRLPFGKRMAGIREIANGFQNGRFAIVIATNNPSHRLIDQDATSGSIPAIITKFDGFQTHFRLPQFCLKTEACHGEPINTHQASSQ